jgi:hypothetical protein
MVEAGLWGFGAGWLTARLINLLTELLLRNLERRLAAQVALDAIDGGTVDVG